MNLLYVLFISTLFLSNYPPIHTSIYRFINLFIYLSIHKINQLSLSTTFRLYRLSLYSSIIQELPKYIDVFTGFDYQKRARLPDFNEKAFKGGYHGPRQG